MPERQQLAQINVITDCDTGMYEIGEVDGGFNNLLEHQVRKYGSDSILRQLAYMTFNVIEIQRKINSENSESGMESV